MTHDLYQNYPTLAAYSPFLNPALAGLLGSPYAGLQGSIFNNPWQNPGLQNPGLQNPFALAMQNPWIAAAQQHIPMVNPVQAQLAGLQAYLMQQPFQQQPFQQHPHLGFAGSAFGPLTSFGPQAAFGPQTSPYPQFNAPIAPQSWVGQGYTGQPGQIGGGYGQINPLLAQIAARAFQGVNPWAGI